MSKKKNIVTYKNEMNTIPLRKFTVTEMDLFFSICSVVQNRGVNEVLFSFEKIKDLSNYQSRSKERFINDLESVYDKLLNLTYRQIDADGDIIEKFVLFTEYKIDMREKLIRVKTNEKFAYILNDLTSEFTQFELREFVQIKSSYSKTMYRLLKQYRRQGYYYIQMDTFKDLLSIPQCYSMSKIDEKVLTPILKDLSLYFKNLKVNKIKKGRSIDTLEFIFVNEDNVLPNGRKIFIDENGNSYSKHLYEFTEEEVRKTYPENPTVPSDKKRFNVNKQLSKKTTKAQKKKVPKYNLNQLELES